MPIYTYKCPKCSEKTEVLQKINDGPPVCKTCTDKDVPAMEKVPSVGSSFVLKGGGWYKDGY